LSLTAASEAAERAARTSFGRLLAYLAAGARDIAAAEDALSEAFASALRVWPVKGVPDNPDAWLLTAARRNILNMRRHANVRDSAMAEIERRYEAAAAAAGEDELPDERLKLLFVCAHPAIDPAVRTPLMLQTVMGLSAERIGGAFLSAPAAMGQRLSRAKAKIRLAGLPFETPGRSDMPERLEAVLDAIYAAFGVGWDDMHGADAQGAGLTAEAIFLAELLVQLMPQEPEAKGLLALMLHCEARRPARRDAEGRFVALDRQDSRLWSRDQVVRAEGLLVEASRAGVYGRYQCEAAIQSVHSQRAVTGAPNHQALLMLYDLLASRSPTVGVMVARAAAMVQAGEPGGALAALDQLAAEAQVDGYQPYWATRAHALAAAGLGDEARQAFTRAAGLATDPAVRAYLLGYGS
jgi:RNA polymerase sigma-70 factor (ECF subfamily)